MSAAEAAPVSAAEAARLFEFLLPFDAILIAVSGGPDSMALLHLLARWRKARRRGPALHVATVDHRLRPASASEARSVAQHAAVLGLPHRVLRWTGDKPRSGLQEAAREARYALLAQAARKANAVAIVTAHTLDDQAETILFRAVRGSGLAGLGGMGRDVALPGGARGELRLLRPLLDMPKARLMATLARHKIAFARDPSNADPRFARVRMRALLPALAEEGLTAAAFARLGQRLRRADEAIEAVCDRAAAALVEISPGPPVSVAMPRAGLASLPGEIRLRLIGRALRVVGGEVPRLGRLEMLAVALDAAPASGRFRRSLAGCVVTLDSARLVVECAPPRRNAADLRKT